MGLSPSPLDTARSYRDARSTPQGSLRGQPPAAAARPGHADLGQHQRPGPRPRPGGDQAQRRALRRACSRSRWWSSIWRARWSRATCGPRATRPTHVCLYRHFPTDRRHHPHPQPPRHGLRPGPAGNPLPGHDPRRPVLRPGAGDAAAYRGRSGRTTTRPATGRVIVERFCRRAWTAGDAHAGGARGRPRPVRLGRRAPADSVHAAPCTWRAVAEMALALLAINPQTPPSWNPTSAKSTSSASTARRRITDRQ